MLRQTWDLFGPACKVLDIPGRRPYHTANKIPCRKQARFIIDEPGLFNFLKLEI